MDDNEVVIIDYGMGNLWSVASAVRFLGFTPVVTSETSIISSAESLILPGVGSFRRAMHEIKSASIDQAIFKSLENPRQSSWAFVWACNCWEFQAPRTV
jgi:imidazoleglycerol phosphate synthase glutamine amidotransferase subunit HisH